MTSFGWINLAVYRAQALVIRLLDLHRADLEFRDLGDGIESGIGQHIGGALNEMEGDEDRIPLHPLAEVGFNLNFSSS